MDAKLIPIMLLLTVVLLPAVAYPFYAFWRARRRVAWNVVNAALILQTATPEQRRALDAEVRSLLPALRLTPERFAGAAPEIRLALYAMAMQRKGLQPPGSGRPFYPLNSPHLARSAKGHIPYVRIYVESEHKLTLTELDRAPTAA
jgi:hypothetical protein